MAAHPRNSRNPGFVFPSTPLVLRILPLQLDLMRGNVRAKVGKVLGHLHGRMLARECARRALCGPSQSGRFCHPKQFLDSPVNVRRPPASYVTLASVHWKE